MACACTRVESFSTTTSNQPVSWQINRARSSGRSSRQRQQQQVVAAKFCAVERNQFESATQADIGNTSTAFASDSATTSCARSGAKAELGILCVAQMGARVFSRIALDGGAHGRITTTTTFCSYFYRAPATAQQQHLISSATVNC